VTQLAKWKTTIQMVAIAFLIVGPAGDQIIPLTSLTGLIFLWIAAIATLYTGLDYFRVGLKHVMDEDE
jgi:cardiolipin synthase